MKNEVLWSSRGLTKVLSAGTSPAKQPEMTNAMPGRLLGGVAVGIGLGSFLISGLTGGLLDLPIGWLGLLALALGVGWFLRERRRLGFGGVASIFTVLIIPLAAFAAYILFMQSLVFVLGAMVEGLALLFVGSVFFAVGLIVVNIGKKPNRTSLDLLVLGLLFLFGVPIVNEYQIVVSRHGLYWVATPYQGYTIPFILVSCAFFVLSCASILYMRSRQRVQTILDSNPTVPGSPSVRREGSTVRNRLNPNPRVLGLLSYILSSFSLVGAAVVYAPMGPVPTSYTVPGTPLDEYPLAFVLAGIAFFALGFGLMFYSRANKLGFFSVGLGCFALIVAAFAHGYLIKVTQLVFADNYVIYPVNPYREYALSFVLVSIVLLAFGYALTAWKSWVANKTMVLKAEELMIKRSKALTFVVILGAAFLIVGATVEAIPVFYDISVLRFAAGPISIVGVGCLASGLAGFWSRGKARRATRKVLVACLLFLTVSFAVGYSFAKTIELEVPPNIYDREKVEIGPVQFENANPNVLSVSLNKTSNWNESVTFTNVLIRNGSGENVANVEIEPFVLPAPVFTEKTLTISLSMHLHSGTYTLLLVTARGNAFASPPFTVP